MNIMQNFKTVSSIVEQCCNETGDPQHSRYQLFLSWALIALKEFHLDAAQVSIIKSFQMDDKKEIHLGNDFVDVIRVGFQSRLSNYLMHVAGATIRMYNFPLTKHTNYVEPIFLQGTEQYFVLDRKSKTISFTSEVANQCVSVEYLSDGYCADEQTMVDDYLYELVRTYIHWQRVCFSEDSTQYQERTWGTKFALADEKARGRILSITPSEFLTSLRHARGN